MTVRKPRTASTAQLAQTLTYFDGPQVALLRTDRNREMLAVHVDRDDMNHAMFACEINKSTLRKYMDQRFDLRYTFTDSEYGIKHYFFDWDSMHDKIVKLKIATKDEIENEDFYPEPGFFSRHHTREYAAPARAAAEAQKYKIDGTWDASDFSKFYGRISDLYAVMTLSSSKLIKSVAEIDLIFVRQTISHYMWRGGGSYVNFYDSVFE
ncbi:hypothetical protein FV242_33185, partial [Methylobacterium sp. WL64]|uniref:hypothetical protein n=1 Tax=Methylobacterium sp. WL64 TaxID=2603894 RepID=UPI0011CAEA40